MIVTLPDTSTTAVDKRLLQMRDEGGAVALGRVLTLVIVACEQDIEMAVTAANDASHEHPCRVIVVVTSQQGQPGPASATAPETVAEVAPETVPARLDAEIRVGSDSGASEVIILRVQGPPAGQLDAVIMPLLVPDAPICVWWPRHAPHDTAHDPLGRMAQVRITDSALAPDHVDFLRHRASTYVAGDTDLAWARLTAWRGLLAAALDQPPYLPVTSAHVEGESRLPALDLLCAWLTDRLTCPVTLQPYEGLPGVSKVVLHRQAADGSSRDITLHRPDGRLLTVSQPGLPDRQLVLYQRTLSEALVEELRRLSVDQVYAQTLTQGLPLFARTGSTAPPQPAPALGAPGQVLPSITQAAVSQASANSGTCQTAGGSQAAVPHTCLPQASNGSAL